MNFCKSVTWLVLMVVGLSGCVTTAEMAEQNARLSREPFSPDYRIAVVTYQLKADNYASPIVHDPSFMIQQGEARKALREVIRLDSVDAAIVSLASRALPASAEVLEVVSDGAILSGNEIGEVSQRALRLAREQGYQAVLFVAVKAVMNSGFAGMVDFDIKLNALTQLHRVAARAEDGETLLLSQSDSVFCTEYVVVVNASQFKTMVDDCVDPLVARIDESLKRRLASR